MGENCNFVFGRKRRDGKMGWWGMTSMSCGGSNNIKFKTKSLKTYAKYH
jgi:hypothetical protein